MTQKSEKRFHKQSGWLTGGWEVYMGTSTWRRYLTVWERREMTFICLGKSPQWNRSCICLPLACFPSLILADIITHLCETVLSPQKLRASEWLNTWKTVQNVQWWNPRYTGKLDIPWENYIFLKSEETKDTGLWICIFPHTALVVDYTNIRWKQNQTLEH